MGRRSGQNSLRRAAQGKARFFRPRRRCGAHVEYGLFPCTLSAGHLLWGLLSPTSQPPEDRPPAAPLAKRNNNGDLPVSLCPVSWGSAGCLCGRHICPITACASRTVQNIITLCKRKCRIWCRLRRTGAAATSVPHGLWPRSARSLHPQGPEPPRLTPCHIHMTLGIKMFCDTAHFTPRMGRQSYLRRLAPKRSCAPSCAPPHHVPPWQPAILPERSAGRMAGALNTIHSQYLPLLEHNGNTVFTRYA